MAATHNPRGMSSGHAGWFRILICAIPPPTAARGSNVRILIVSWYFPPTNTMGALRVGKFAKFLVARGHDVRVLSAADVPGALTLTPEVDESIVERAAWFDVNALPRAVQAVRKKAARNTGSAAQHPDRGETAGIGQTQNAIRAVRNLYLHLTNFPDGQIGWFPAAVRSGRRLLAAWRPDLIFASGPPFTTLLIGHRLSRLHGVPVIFEYRDQWAENPYGDEPMWRRKADFFLEDRVVRRVSAIVTVSEPLADEYKRRFGLPVKTVYNGFDATDFPADYAPRSFAPAGLRIVYTGILYPARRDPTPLFRALRSLGEEAGSVRVQFYGAQSEFLTQLARREGVSDLVECFPRVSHHEAIRLQMNADALLLLQWNDPREVGTLPGKLFEYLGARRPVIGIGYEGGVSARMLRERQAGWMLNEPERLAECVADLLRRKRQQGEIPLLPLSAREGLSRDGQYAELERFLAQFARGATPGN